MWSGWRKRPGFAGVWRSSDCTQRLSPAVPDGQGGTWSGKSVGIGNMEDRKQQSGCPHHLYRTEFIVGVHL